MRLNTHYFIIKGLGVVLFDYPTFFGFGGGLIIRRFISNLRTLFLSCCGTHACFPGVAYSLLLGFPIYVVNNPHRATKFSFDKSLIKLVM